VAVADLVAIDLPGGDEFVKALCSIWDAGDAVAPLDQRLAPPARQAQLEALAPKWVVGPGGARRAIAGRPVAEGDALVVATSGSTGEPKGVVLTHEAVKASALATSERLGIKRDRHRWLACLPLAHIGGLSVITRALLTGVPLDVHPGFDAERLMACATTSTYVALVAAALGRVRADAFARILLGGSAPPAYVPANAVTTYGMTETASGVVYDGYPLDGVEVQLTPKSEILLRGPMLAREYRDGSGTVDADGWLYTGDSGFIGPGGRLAVQGRLSDMLVTGGENVWPLPVEQLLAQHPGVREVALSAKPDERWGERLVAVVVPSHCGPGPSLDELRDIIKGQLAPFAAPKQVVTVASLPRTSLGKIRRDELRRWLAASEDGPPSNDEAQ
jgi:O-succinylbenzoic acid--CoA ligase